MKKLLQIAGKARSKGTKESGHFVILSDRVEEKAMFFKYFCSRLKAVQWVAPTTRFPPKVNRVNKIFSWC